MTTEVEFHDALDPALVDDLLAFFEREWWTEDRERPGIERMLEGSDLVISATAGGRLVGFVRAITDGVYVGKILDLIVDPEWRGRGLGVELIERAHAHPVLADCGRISLICVEDMVPFYAARGYEMGPPEHLRMTWTRPDQD